VILGLVRGLDLWVGNQEVSNITDGDFDLLLGIHCHYHD
jgi:hypothetical protein